MTKIMSAVSYLICENYGYLTFVNISETGGNG